VNNPDLNQDFNPDLNPNSILYCNQDREYFMRKLILFEPCKELLFFERAAKISSDATIPNLFLIAKGNKL
jgi:hypothetical protein